MKYLPIFGCLFGCLADEDYGAKGPEAMPAAAPVAHGRLSDGDADAATISRIAPLHAWRVALDGDALVEVVTGAAVVGPDVDTVVYVFPAGDDAWIARADDGDGTLFSALAEELPAGTYDIVVKGYRDDTAGPFEVRLTTSTP